MKVLVTGSKGFLGQHLISSETKNELLQYSDSVTSFTPPELPLDCIVHLAGKTSVPESWSNPKNFYDSNVNGTLQVLEYCRLNKTKLIYISTCPYKSPFSLPIKEDHPIGAANPYTHSKLIAEQMCEFYSEKFDFPLTIARLFNVFGPNQKETFLIPTIIRQVLDRQTDEISLQSLTPKRDYIYVSDVIKFIIMAIENNMPGIFNIGSGHSHSVKELVDSLQKSAGTNKKVLSKNVDRPNEILDIYADITKAKSFGWSPLISLEEGLRLTLAATK